MKRKIREILFKGFHGCNDGYCIVRGRSKGVHTNGGCKCMTDFSRAEIQILTSRLRTIVETEIEI